MSLRKKTYDFISVQKKSNYGFYLGSFKKWNTLIWNIIFPERLISRFKGKTLFRKKFDEKYYKFYNKLLQVKLLVLHQVMLILVLP